MSGNCLELPQRCKGPFPKLKGKWDFSWGRDRKGPPSLRRRISWFSGAAEHGVPLERLHLDSRTRLIEISRGSRWQCSCESVLGFLCSLHCLSRGLELNSSGLTGTSGFLSKVMDLGVPLEFPRRSRGLFSCGDSKSSLLELEKAVTELPVEFLRIGGLLSVHRAVHCHVFGVSPRGDRGVCKESSVSEWIGCWGSFGGWWRACPLEFL